MADQDDDNPLFSRTAMGCLSGDLDEKIECRYNGEAKIRMMRTARDMGLRNGYADLLRLISLRVTFGYQFIVDHYGTIVADALERHLVNTGRDVGQMSANGGAA